MFTGVKLIFVFFFFSVFLSELIRKRVSADGDHNDNTADDNDGDATINECRASVDDSESISRGLVHDSCTYVFVCVCVCVFSVFWCVFVRFFF